MASFKKNLVDIKNKVVWVAKEIGKIYSSKDSYFSKKRIESGIAFIIAEWGMIYYFVNKVGTMSNVELLTWATIQFGISGYMVSQIEKSKCSDSDTTTDTDTTVE